MTSLIRLNQRSIETLILFPTSVFLLKTFKILQTRLLFYESPTVVKNYQTYIENENMLEMIRLKSSVGKDFYHTETPYTNLLCINHC